MNIPKFFICKTCGNIAGLIFDSGVNPDCCGEPMTLLMANTRDASVEKHVPVADFSKNCVEISVGVAPHPMSADHWIQWIYLLTDQGGHRYELTPGMVPKASFFLKPEEHPLAVYAYCNLHGLWKKDIS